MGPQLLSGEREIATARQHWSIAVPPILGSAVILVVVLVILAVIPSKIGSTGIGTVKLAIAALAAVVLVVHALIRWLQWRYATFTLTDHRIVVTKGVISRVTESIALDRIQDTVVRKPLADRLIHAGDIEIESAGRDGTEVLRRIPRADEFYTQLLQAIETHRVSGMAPPLPPQGFAQGPQPGYAPPGAGGGL